MSTRTKSSQKLRMAIAEKAAKLIAIDGIADYHSAKKKAAVQLGLAENKELPTNKEIEEALINYQNLFHSDMHFEQLRTLRLKAIKAMELLRQFNPVSVGPVVVGTATKTSEISLHLFVDNFEKVGLFLTEKCIPYTLTEKHIKINARQHIVFPAYRFLADQTAISLVIFSEKDKNLNPVSSIDNKPMVSANIESLLNMLEVKNEPVH